MKYRLYYIQNKGCRNETKTLCGLSTSLPAARAMATNIQTAAAVRAFRKVEKYDWYRDAGDDELRVVANDCDGDPLLTRMEAAAFLGVPFKSFTAFARKEGIDRESGLLDPERHFYRTSVLEAYLKRHGQTKEE